MSTADDLRLDVIDTPEGRAIYPFGAWGAGYLVDATTERKLRSYLGRMVWIIVAVFMLQGFARVTLGMAFHARIPEFAAMAVAFFVFLAVHFVVLKRLLRNSPRAAYRTSSRELLRLRLAKGGRMTMVFALWCGLVVLGAIAIMLAIVTEGPERWGIEIGCAAFATLFVVALRRIETIPD